MQEDIPAILVATITVFVIAVAWLLLRRVPGIEDSQIRRVRYVEAEISDYDRALPKFAVGSILALFLGSVHLALTRLPPIMYG